MGGYLEELLKVGLFLVGRFLGIVIFGFEINNIELSRLWLKLIDVEYER